MKLTLKTDKGIVVLRLDDDRARSELAFCAMSNMDIDIKIEHGDEMGMLRTERLLDLQPEYRVEMGSNPGGGGEE